MSDGWLGGRGDAVGLSSRRATDLVCECLIAHMKCVLAGRTLSDIHVCRGIRSSSSE